MTQKNKAKKGVRMSIELLTPEVREFLKEIYGEYPELGITCFTEKQALITATNELRKFRILRNWIMNLSDEISLGSEVKADKEIKVKELKVVLWGLDKNKEKNGTTAKI